MYVKLSLVGAQGTIFTTLFFLVYVECVRAMYGSLTFSMSWLQDTRYKNLYLTADTFKQIKLAIKAIFQQTYYKANIQQVKISCKRKTF